MIDRQHASTASLDEVRAEEVLERFRQPIEDALHRALDDRPAAIYRLLRYHLGLDGESPPQGKALRPTLCLLTCDALGGDYHRALPAAASIELIHNFSLIHDDIQDGDELRRGRPTIWMEWGMPQAINAGDAMFAIATLTLRDLRPAVSDADVVEAMSVMHEATREMIEGQFLDVGYEDVPVVTLDEYLEMIRCKTGALLRASIELGALMAGASSATRLCCRRFGEAIGRLFQIRDDMLGVWGESETTGKSAENDIRRKKKSLPIVMALSMAEERDRSALLSIYGQEDLSSTDVQRVQSIFEGLCVKQRAQALADEAHDRALSLVEDIPFTDRGRAEVLSLVSFLLERDH